MVSSQHIPSPQRDPPAADPPLRPVAAGDALLQGASRHGAGARAQSPRGCRLTPGPPHPAARVAGPTLRLLRVMQDSPAGDTRGVPEGTNQAAQKHTWVPAVTTGQLRQNNASFPAPPSRQAPTLRPVNSVGTAAAPALPRMRRSAAAASRSGSTLSSAGCKRGKREGGCITRSAAGGSVR